MGYKLSLVILLFAALWLTRPGEAITKCETVNTVQQCETLNAE